MHCEDDGTGGFAIGGDDATFFPQMWTWAIDRYKISTVLDIGCGEGHALRWFAKAGLIARGIDGSPTGVERSGALATRHDLRSGPYMATPVDLVWCCEVAEHVEPESVGHLIDTMKTGRVVMMTHGFPQQGGFHHVNLRTSDYWIDLMRRAGFTLDAEATMQSRYFAWRDCRNEYNHWLRSGMIFTR